MSSVTITEKYALCMLKETKRFENQELSVHLIVAMILEMMKDNNLEIIDYNSGNIFDSTSKVKIVLNDDEPSDEYNKELYKFIKEMNKSELSIDELVHSICYGFSDKKYKVIVNALKQKMNNDELISFETKKGLFGNKEIIVVNDDKFTEIIEEIRSRILEKEDLTENLILLASLLNSTKFLKNIFMKYEKETLKKRLEEIKDTEISKRVKIARDIIDAMDATVIIAMS